MTSDLGTPVGLNCPGCGEPPVMLMGGGTQAFCGTDDCPYLTWDPMKTRAELNAEAKRIDLRPEWCGDPSECVHGPSPHPWHTSCQKDYDVTPGGR